MEFGILGATELIVNGRMVPLGPAKQRGMLAVLLFHAGKPVRTDTMIELLWPHRGSEDHRPALYSLASRLRSVLVGVGLDQTLIRVPGIGAYRLDVNPGMVDVHRFRQRLAEARTAAEQNRPESAGQILVQALLLWRGDPLPEVRGARAEQLRRSLDDALLEAHKLLAESRLACGHPDSVLDQLDGVIRTHDLDEALAGCWIRALHLTGRHDEAKRFATVFRRRFRKEMHAEPDIEVGIVAARPASRPIVAPVPRHLPPDIADFTGRRTLLDELDQLKNNNVVVVTGMPGVGKTTLATHWAHGQRALYPDGQLYLDAAAFGPTTPIDPRDALDRFLRAFGIPPDQLPATLEQRRDRFEDLIGDRRVLILVDNVLDSAQVRPLIPRSMNCLTVITSRTRLSGLTIRDGVRTVTVTPLPEVEATSLLARIVGAGRGSEIAGLKMLARLSGGLPLAVRIIGERVAERPRAGIAELAGELRHRLLDAGGEDDQAASLTKVFEWSYQALHDDAASMFRRISLYPGTSISPEAAAVVVDKTVEDAEKTLNVLAKAHMINHDTFRRYRFHSLLHRYAIEQAAAEDGPALADRELERLLNWYLLSAVNAVAAIAPEWPAMTDLPDASQIVPMSFRSGAEAMKWFDAERDNLCSVSRWAQDRGHHRHGWQIPGVIHEILERYGCQEDVLKLNQQALAAARRDGHEVGQIGTLNNLGTTYFAVHDYGRAVAAFVEARQLAAAIGHFEAETLCSHNLASTYVLLGEAHRAIEIYENALEACRKMANPAGESAVLNWLGKANLELGRHERAAENYHRALAIREQIGAERGAGQSHLGLAAVYLAVGRFRSALRHCEAALAIQVRTHDQEAECDALIILAGVLCGLENHAEALRIGRRAVLLGEQISDSFRQVEALTVVGDAFVGAGDQVSARHQIGLAWRILDGLTGVRAPALRERLRIVERTAQVEPPEAQAG